MDQDTPSKTFTTSAAAGFVQGRRRAPLMWAVLAFLASAVWNYATAATIMREITINAAPSAVWDAVRDVGAVDRRLAAGLVVSDQLEGGIRTLTFANGRVIREVIISTDDGTRRIAFAPVGSAAMHQSSSMQVFPSGEESRLVWITDVLPDSLAGPIAGTVENILAVIKGTLERKQ